MKKDGYQAELRKQIHTCIHHSDTAELQRPREHSLNCGVEKIDHLEFLCSAKLSLNNKCKGRNFSGKNGEFKTQIFTETSNEESTLQEEEN